MSIPTSWDKIRMPHGNLAFNVNVGTEEEPDYYPLRVNIDVPKVTTGGAVSQSRVVKYVGTNRPEPFEVETLQGMMDLYQALPSFAQGAFKEAILEAIGEDASA